MGCFSNKKMNLHFIRSGKLQIKSAALSGVEWALMNDE
jgi:hypothetical protein